MRDMKTKAHTLIGIALCRINSDSAAAFQLFPAGRFRATDGRPKDCEGWIVDDPAALISQAKAKANGFVVDYEHQSLAAAQNGQPAPAAGWFEGAALEWRDDGMYVVSTTWTARASAYLKADEYRYISPVFRYDTKTGKVLELLSVALTNTPALDGMQAVVAAASQLTTQQDTLMDLLARLTQELGLPDGATDDTVVEAVKQLLKVATDVAAAEEAAIVSDTKNKQSANPGRNLAEACKTENSDAVTAALASEVAALRAERDADMRDRLLADNPAKLSTPGLQAWAKTQSYVALKAFVDSAPAIAALTQSQTGGKSPDGKDATVGMDAEQLAVLKLTGVSPALVAQYGGVK